MAYTTIVTGTTITSSWANADVRDQVIVPFASTAARSAAITSPVAGQVSTLTTNLSTEGIYSYNSAAQWRAPWNLPWGYMVSSTTTAATATSSTTETALATSSSFTAVANRYYRVSLVASLENSVALDAFSLRLRLDSAAGTVLSLNRHLPAGTGEQFTVQLFDDFSTTAGSHTVVFTAQRISGTGTLSVLSGIDTKFLIEDIGPSGAPS